MLLNPGLCLILGVLNRIIIIIIIIIIVIMVSIVRTD